MKYTVSLDVIDEEMLEIFQQVYPTAESIFSGDYSEAERTVLEYIYAECLYRYIILAVLRGVDEELASDDVALLKDEFTKVLRKYKHPVVTEYLDSERITFEQLADEIFDDIEDSFEGEQCVDSAAIADIESKFLDEIDVDYMAFTCATGSIRFMLYLNDDIMARGVMVADYGRSSI